MIIGKDTFDVQVLNGTRERLLKVKRYLDGRHALSEIQELTGETDSSVREVIELFERCEALRQEKPVAQIPTSQFLEKLDSTTQMWSRQIGFHRLFGGLEQGLYRKEVLDGLLLETYHYVKSAPSHTATAISSCVVESWKNILVGYLSEESNHAQLLLKTLCNVGMEVRHVELAHPLIGTISLVNMLREIGRRSTLGYLCCTSLIEARAGYATEGIAALLRIGKQYGYTEDQLHPLISHFTGDIQAGHSSLIGEALRDRDHLDAEEVNIAINHLHDLKHAFDQFHDQIVQYYSDISNYIPRLTVDYFSL